VARKIYFNRLRDSRTSFDLSSLRTFKILDFRNKGLDRFKFIGTDRSPVNGIKNIGSNIELGGKRCDIESGFIRKVFYPEDLVDFQAEVPANPLTQTFGTSCFEKPFTGLGRHNDVRSEMLHIGLFE